MSDPVGLQTYFDNWVQTNHTFSFNPLNVTFGQTLTSILGNINIKNQTGTLDTGVFLDSTTNWVIHRLTFDLNFIVSSCSAYGATEIYTPTNAYYNIPISLMQRDYQNDFDSISSTFYINMNLQGVVQSVSSSSAYQPTLLRSELSSITTTCPAGSARLQITYLIQIGNVYTSGTNVGPRNASGKLICNKK